LVLCEALSTAFKPFTPVAPPEEELMLSQPGPRGAQLTAGIVTAARVEAPEPCLRRGSIADGRASGRADEAAETARGDSAAVDGEW
jgi:hypothetical protein